MQRHHTGSGRRKVIPADWSAHHRGVLDTTRTAAVTLRHPGGVGGTFNRTTGKYADQTPNPAYYTGSARIQVTPANERDQLAAEQEVTTLPYAVMLDDAVVGIQLDDILEVTAMDNNGDQALVGAEMLVSSIQSGSLHWERRLVCTLDLETPS